MTATLYANKLLSTNAINFEVFVFVASRHYLNNFHLLCICLHSAAQKQYTLDAVLFSAVCSARIAILRRRLHVCDEIFKRFFDVV